MAGIGELILIPYSIATYINKIYMYYTTELHSKLHTLLVKVLKAYEGCLIAFTVNNGQLCLCLLGQWLVS